MAYTVSPNMNLLVPIVGQELGPTYALDINTNLQTLIDQHDHSPGRGVQITPSGLNISSDLSIGGNSLTFIKSGQFVAQSSSLSTTNSIYSVNGNLYWTGLSTPVQITNGASIVGSGGTITGLPSGTAGASYASGTFTWVSSSTTAAVMDSGPLTIRTSAASSGYVQLAPQPGFGTGSSYNLYFPLSLPSVQSFMTLDASGNMAAPWTVDNNTIKITANQLVAQVLNNMAREHSWELNGNYGSLAYPLNNIDSIFLVPYNIKILSVWIYSGTAGSAGTTEFDLKVATTSGGSFTSILSTTGKITSAAGSTVWTDSGSVVGSQTGITKPVLSTTAISAGSAIRWDLIQAMTGPSDARIKIFYVQS